MLFEENALDIKTQNLSSDRDELEETYQNGIEWV